MSIGGPEATEGNARWLGEFVGVTPAITVWQGLLDRAARHADWLRPALLCHYGARLSRNGLNAGGCGNLSTRSRRAGTIYITPRGVDKAYLTPRSIRRVPLDVSTAGTHGVSIEFPMHRACYHASTAIGAVVHTHAPALTALPLRGLDLASALPEMPMAVGGVRYLPYAEAGSDALAGAVGAAVGDAALLLLEHHGAVAVGDDLAQAVRRMEFGELAAVTALLMAGEGRGVLEEHGKRLEGR
jgi:L-fuculose-phosphate aldolase